MQLLVSVRSAEEAEAALTGGAEVIDVKDPAQGSLGRANPEILASVLEQVAGRRPVSAALGELSEPTPRSSLPHELAFAKWGLARTCELDWQALVSSCVCACATPCVLVAYADAGLAQAPPVSEVLDLALDLSCAGLLIDTFVKNGSTLLDHLSQKTLLALAKRCRKGQLPLALAGSLGPEEISQLIPVRPNWFGVRGAVCEGKDRQQQVDSARVRELVCLLQARRLNRLRGD